MKQTFKDRLKILINGQRPYTFAKQIGIEKGLFQYYWQKGNIPTYEQLLKIARHTGCSLHWLLTGNEVDYSTIKKPGIDGLRAKRYAHAMEKLEKIYRRKNNKDVDAMEYWIDVIRKR